MVDDAFHKQAEKDAQKVRDLPEDIRQRLDRETDWSGFRMRGYEFPAKAATRS